MRKILFFVLCYLFATSIFGVQIFISKDSEKSGSLCQAVRIKDAWFLTAAHCVRQICANNSCEAEIPFVGKTKKVSWPTKAQDDKAFYDIALVNFDKEKNNLPPFNEPTILIAKNIKFNEPKTLNRKLIINSETMSEVKQIRSWAPVFYGPNHKIIFTEEMGLWHSLSGAGVMTDKGELISVVSGVASNGGAIKFSAFPVFDSDVEIFLSQIPGLKFAYLREKDFSDMEERYKEAAVSLDNSK